MKFFSTISMLLICLSLMAQTKMGQVCIYPEGDKIMFRDVDGSIRSIADVIPSPQLTSVENRLKWAHAGALEFQKNEEEYHVSYSNNEGIYYLHSSDNGLTWTKEKIDDIDNHQLLAFDLKTGEPTGDTVKTKYMGLIHGCRIVLDSRGAPHIVYGISGGNYHYDAAAIYARKKAGKWTTERVSTKDGLPRRYIGYVAIDLNSKDKPHIVVHSHEEVNTTRHTLGLFIKEKKGWVKKVVTEKNTGSPYMNIKIDENDHIHVQATLSSDNAHYWFSTDGGNHWKEDFLVKGNCRGQMELDEAGNPHVSFACYNDGIYYTKKEGVNWQIQKLEDRNQMTHTSIAISPEGEPNVAFFGFYHGDTDVIRYYKSSGKWEKDTLLRTKGSRGSSWGPELSFAKMKEPQESIRYQEDRQEKIIKTLQVSVSDIIISISDHAKEDGDIVSLKLGDDWILENHALTTKPNDIPIRLQPGKNRLKLYALNLGKIPPNTATITIWYGQSKETIKLSSDLKESGCIDILLSPSDDR